MVDKYEVHNEFDRKEIWKRVLTEGKKPELQKFIDNWLIPYDQCHLHADPEMIVKKHHYHFSNSRFLQTFGRQKIINAISDWQKRHEHLRKERPPELDNGEWYNDMGYAVDRDIYGIYDEDGVLRTELKDIELYANKDDFKALRDGHKTIFDIWET